MFHDDQQMILLLFFVKIDVIKNKFKESVIRV